nr:PsaJ [Alaria praelonga]UAX21663.1 PsaJ [Alaria praelonga]
MDNFLKYLSTAPVLFVGWMTFTAGFIIEANRFYPDALTFPTF